VGRDQDVAGGSLDVGIDVSRRNSAPQEASVGSPIEMSLRLSMSLRRSDEASFETSFAHNLSMPDTFLHHSPEI